LLIYLIFDVYNIRTVRRAW